VGLVQVEAKGWERRAGPELEEALEQGHILFFPESPVRLADEERAFLLRQKQTRAGYHKNIAYRPESDRLTGIGSATREEKLRLRQTLRLFTQRATEFAAKLLPDYAKGWKLDYASFRPEEEAGRNLSVHSQNDLLHVDAFPSRPTAGDRILRVFTNINPQKPRVWLTGPTFDELAPKFADRSGLLRHRERRVASSLRAVAHALGLPVRVRSPYDEFMLGFHNFLKENREFQASAPKAQTSFPPGSLWIVFTDMVSHAVLSGQFALEQTLIVSRTSLTLPEKAPLAIFEGLLAARSDPGRQSSAPGARP
jgi:hypothetical protein